MSVARSQAPINRTDATAPALIDNPEMPCEITRYMLGTILLTHGLSPLGEYLHCLQFNKGHCFENQVTVFFIIPLVCHSDPIQHLVLTWYNQYRVSRIFKKIFFFCLKLLETSQYVKKCKKFGVLT